MRFLSASLTFVALAAVACAPAVVGSPTPASAALGARTGQLTGADRVRHTLSRLTFGLRPGDVEAVERMGLDAWLDRQLHPERIVDTRGDSILDLLDITHKTAFELIADHPQSNEFGLNPIAQQAKMDSLNGRPSATSRMSAVAELAALRQEMEEENRRVSLGARLNQIRASAVRELPTSILLRATVSDRQLLEVMTAFWENHFSVSIDKQPNPFALVDYDHAVRAHALGKFRALLEAVAKSPTMLFYLDNYQSFVDSLHPTVVEWQIEQRRAAHPPLGDTGLIRSVRRRRTGLNENYARELMELHTLGVDGGYTQKDVQEVARCLTGWGIENLQLGGSFVFQPQLHDAGEKMVLGVRIAGGRGIEDGEQVLDILARHPSTAHFIATKLATHFVSDVPPASLVDRLAQVYLHTDGDIREMMRALVASPEFNSAAAYRAKVKTPFELVASILRVMNAAPDTLPQATQLVARLGQPIFGRLTPDGWPDQGSAWMNTGALMNRINLGQQAVASQLPGVRLIDWKPLQSIYESAPDVQPDAVINAVLGGDASPETRRAMHEVARPERRTAYVGELLSIALGSSDFQRR